MKNMKEITFFSFPKVSNSKPGKDVALDLTNALLVGQEEIKKVYDNADNPNLTYDKKWCLHRFILLQTFFNKGCVIKNNKTNELIDENIFNLLNDLNIKKIIENKDIQGSAEKIAIITSEDVVSSFIQGTNALINSYNDANGFEEPKLRKSDHTGWLRQYYKMIEIMLNTDSDLLILIPDEIIKQKPVSNDEISNKNEKMTIAELKQKKRLENN